MKKEISIDPLYVTLAKIANTSIDIETMNIINKVGRYTMFPHYLVDCLMYSLEDSPKTNWKIILYLLRNICGKAINKKGKCKTYINYSPIDLMKKMNIKSSSQFYKAIKNLSDKKIIFFSDKKLYLNLFPLTWHLEFSEKKIIKEIIEEEIKKINKKMS